MLGNTAANDGGDRGDDENDVVCDQQRWDPKLQELAGKWAMQCTTDHDKASARQLPGNPQSPTLSPFSAW